MINYDDPKIIERMRQIHKESENMSCEELEKELFTTPEQLKKLVADIESGKVGRFMIGGDIDKFIADVKAGKHDDI